LLDKCADVCPLTANGETAPADIAKRISAV